MKGSVMQSDAITILIVDDDEVDIRAITRAIRKHGIDNPIVVANNGLEALELMRGTGEDALSKPYLVLLDINMPLMSGIEFLNVMREDPQFSDAIVFVLSTSNDDSDILAAYRQHVVGYILKNDAGQDFINLVIMLDYFKIIVRCPRPQAA